ncbi:predicted protein [Sclerotinia sclerotiorum 1980 UF-70]|uniref:Uncharacterized protein n=1 Tax=Sclerotinia sclerotiorum (strain ATCC 18683 / 1980 / Ss-1) TaxID=665079 RepID=A7EH82_SCLS1|nr:predicted protein [Sclerotinia sclerotiorum 1980 UF-70]EDO02198.1 predicted protein [Sclerotinia sclerotiorum 1980 UF-70]
MRTYKPQTTNLQRGRHLESRLKYEFEAKG